jgi:hypothetical protein
MLLRLCGRLGTAIASGAARTTSAFTTNSLTRRNAMSRFVLTAVVALTLLVTFGARIVRAEQVRCEGTITKIDGEKVTIKDNNNHDQHMEVVPATKVMVDGKPSKPSDLKVGQHVSCTCDKQGDKMTCTTIETKPK